MRTRLPRVLNSLEVETDLSRNCPRRNVVRAAEGGKEVVEREVIGQVNYLQACAPLVAIPAE